jgi:hypothetical protein
LPSLFQPLKKRRNTHAKESPVTSVKFDELLVQSWDQFSIFGILHLTFESKALRAVWAGKS